MSTDTTLDSTEPGPDERAWYLQGIWPLVLAIPALTVVAGLSTVWIANHKADPIIEDTTRPDIVAMHADPVPDRSAAALGLSASLAANGGHLRIELHAAAGDAPGELKIVFAHAAKETYDQTAIAMRTAPGVYEASSPTLVDGPWYVEVAPLDRRWRLTGQMTATGSPARLSPHAAP